MIQPFREAIKCEPNKIISGNFQRISYLTRRQLCIFEYNVIYLTFKLFVETKSFRIAYALLGVQGLGVSDGGVSGRSREEVTCPTKLATSKHLCLPRHYNKFDLPLPDTVNIIDIGIDIVDVLRINDKVCSDVILTKLFVFNHMPLNVNMG